MGRNVVKDAVGGAGGPCPGPLSQRPSPPQLLSWHQHLQFQSFSSRASQSCWRSPSSSSQGLFPGTSPWGNRTLPPASGMTTLLRDDLLSRVYSQFRPALPQDPFLPFLSHPTRFLTLCPLNLCPRLCLAGSWRETEGDQDMLYLNISKYNSHKHCPWKLCA